MKVFVSHDFDNKPEFENVVEWLVQIGVPYWDSSEVRLGSSLRDQLRAAVGQCGVCIFVATRASVESSWCGAELGAFWGAGKPIIVYIAEASLAEDALPPIVRGDLWDRKISNVVKEAGKRLSQTNSESATSVNSPSLQVANMTVEQLDKIVSVYR